jgi:hypothetical protein
MHTHTALVALILQVRNNFMYIRWLHTSTSTCTDTYLDFLPSWLIQILHSCPGQRPCGMRNYVRQCDIDQVNICARDHVYYTIPRRPVVLLRESQPNVAMFSMSVNPDVTTSIRCFPVLFMVHSWPPGYIIDACFSCYNSA